MRAQCKSPESLNTSIAAFWAYLNGNKSDEDATQPAGMYVDVRDVAKCHVDALATPEAGNKRFCVSAGESRRVDPDHLSEREDML